MLNSFVKVYLIFEWRKWFRVNDDLYNSLYKRKKSATEDVIWLRSTISPSRNNPVFTTLLKYVRFCRRYPASRQITHLHPRIQWSSCTILCMYVYAHPSIIFAFSSQGRLVSSSKASPISSSRRFLPSRKDTVKSSIRRSERRTRSVSCGNSRSN